MGFGDDSYVSVGLLNLVHVHCCACALGCQMGSSVRLRLSQAIGPKGYRRTHTSTVSMSWSEEPIWLAFILFTCSFTSFSASFTPTSFASFWVTLQAFRSKLHASPPPLDFPPCAAPPCAPPPSALLSSSEPKSQPDPGTYCSAAAAAGVVSVGSSATPSPFRV